MILKEYITIKKAMKAVLTKCYEFKTYDWEKIYTSMMKRAFVLDGREVLDKKSKTDKGFKLCTIGR